MKNSKKTLQDLNNVQEDNETINETLSPLTNISTGYSHLIRCDIASKANTTPDVIRDIFCIDISTISMFLI